MDIMLAMPKLQQNHQKKEAQNIQKRQNNDRNTKEKTKDEKGNMKGRKENQLQK
jgi:hypothetical protein